LDALNADSGVALTELKVDGGMIQNNTLMQFQADILGVPVISPVVAETTALGAAYAAGLAVGFWADLDQLKNRWQESNRWIPNMTDEERQRQIKLWKKAVTKSLDWA
jgi:glycerol kinase